MSLAGEQTELWVNAQNSKGEVFKTIWNCTDITRFEKEEPVVSKQIVDGLAAFIAADKEGSAAILRDWKQGYRLTIGEWEYKIVQDKNGKRILSRQQPKGAGGKTFKPFTVFRTVEVKIGRAEEIPKIINNQQIDDNWEINYISTDTEGDKFLLLNKKPYTPPQAGAVQTQKSDSNIETTEGSSEEN